MGECKVLWMHVYIKFSPMRISRVCKCAVLLWRINVAFFACSCCKVLNSSTQSNNTPLLTKYLHTYILFKSVPYAGVVSLLLNVLVSRLWWDAVVWWWWLLSWFPWSVTASTLRLRGRFAATLMSSLWLLQPQKDTIQRFRNMTQLQPTVFVGNKRSQWRPLQTSPLKAEDLGIFRKAALFLTCLRMAGCAVLVEPRVHNCEALPQ